MATRKTEKKTEKKAPAPKVEAPKAKAPKAKAPKADVAAQALKTANEAAAATRKLRKQMEDEGVITNPHAMKTGGDLYREKKAALQGGSSRIAWLVVLAITCVSIMAANELVWKVGDNAYIDAEGDMTINSVNAADESTVDGKYAVTGGDATTGLMLQAAAVTASTNTTQTITFGTVFGAAPTVVCTYTEDQGDVRSIFVTSVNASNFVANITSDKNFGYVAIGARP